jgi:SAM-dependent methyltransferase
VLVLGAGTGNDIAAALRNGAHRVVAVEIDPLVLKLGKQLHFEQPYASSRVDVIRNDARSYVQNGSERFDLIIFSLLDSLTTSSYYTNIRIDNYVYTLEAIAATSRLLKPDGILVLKIVMVRDPAQSSRLAELEQTVFGSPPLVFQTVRPVYTAAARFFIDGSQTRIARALLDPRLAAYVDEGRIPTMEHVPLTTDDWPYLYQNEPGVPASVIVISAVLIILCGFFLRETGTPLCTLRLHFFFLGAGFLILEAQIISRMALFFGTTWFVNSIVIAAILVMIVAANLLVQWKPSISYTGAYGGIFASILIAYLVPIESFFFSSVWVKGLTAAFTLCLPVFFAGIVFIRSFACERFRSEALGSNLFGALVGGMLESISMWTGMRSLLIFAGCLYLASLIAMRFQSRMINATKAAGLEIKLMAAGSGG